MTPALMAASTAIVDKEEAHASSSSSSAQTVGGHSGASGAVADFGSGPTLHSTSIAATPDELDELDACVKETILLAFSSAVMHSAARDLASIREAVLGPERIKQLIAEGCSPDMIGTMIVSRQELLDGFKSVQGGVRDLALGFTVVQMAAQYETSNVTDDLNLDSARLRRFRKILQDMKTDPPKKDVVYFPIDYSDLYAYIEEERFNGSLVNDPAWEVTTSSIKKGQSWQKQLKKNLELLDQNFRQASDEVDWAASSCMDSHILEAVSAKALIALTVDCSRSASFRLSSGPLPSDGHQGLPWIDDESLPRLGRNFRNDVLDHCKEVANDMFRQSDFQEAETLYRQALEAGSNDAAVSINRAAALVKLERFEEAVEACTLGLTLLDTALQPGAKQTLSGKKKKTMPSPRSRSMVASAEEIEDLRWKAYVRRGRAHKAILTQLGGLRDERERGPPVESDDDDDVDQELAERRGQMLLAARDDFATALSIDPLDDLPRQEMASLTINPLQRRPSGQDISQGLALASISQLDREQRRASQTENPFAQTRRDKSH